VNGLRNRTSPELVATLLAVVVVVAVLGIRAPSGTAAPASPSASPSASVRPTGSDPLSAVVRSALETVVVVNGRLAASAQDLDVALARTEPRGPEIAVVLPRISAQVTGVAQPVSVLTADPLTGSLGSALNAIYGPLTEAIRSAQRESVQNTAAYVKAGKTATALIGQLGPLTAQARAILAGGLASAKPAPSATATPRATSSPTRSLPPPSPTPRSPTPSPVQGGLILDPGFEDGLDPWALELVAPAAGSLVLDRSDPGAGAASARIDITTDTGARSAISLTQSGIAIRAGQTYTVRLLVRASAARDLRVRVAAANGDTYVARILPVTTSWVSLSFAFNVLVDDATAVFGIDLGQSTATTWIDSVALTEGG
jgi:hypothetical protein